jgi:hypothetical protein
MVTIKRRDIISDIIQRIQAAEEASKRRLDAELARQIELEARASWGGCKVHVPIRPCPAERAARVQSLLLDGHRIVDIAEHEGVTPRTVLNIARRR